MYSEKTAHAAIEVFRAAAAAVGCELLVVETNLRDFTERFQPWDVTFGGALAGIGLAMGSAFSHVLLSADFPSSVSVSYGSQQDLDPLWSTERTAVVHEGMERTRLEKVRYLADQPIVLQTLKVCYGKDTVSNCGRCDKCLRTMLELYACGALENARCFEKPLKPRRIAKLDLGRHFNEQFLPEIAAALQGSSSTPRALRRALRRVTRAIP